MKRDRFLIFPHPSGSEGEKTRRRSLIERQEDRHLCERKNEQKTRRGLEGVVWENRDISVEHNLVLGYTGQREAFVMDILIVCRLIQANVDSFKRGCIPL